METVTPKDIAQDIIKNHLVVWVNGSAEIGPRALGNRSLLADPRLMEAKDKLNMIKNVNGGALLLQLLWTIMVKNIFCNTVFHQICC